MTNQTRSYVTAKTASAVKLDGIAITFDKANETLRGVFLRDASGNVLRIVMESYSMSAQIIAPPKKEKRHIVRGDVPVLGKVEKAFEERHEADAYKRELENAVRGEVELAVVCEEVEVTDDGAVKGAANTDDIPF